MLRAVRMLGVRGWGLFLLMYSHPALVVDHAWALAPSPRAFNRWFWKDAWQGVFPEFLLPSPAPGQPQDQAGGSLQAVVLFARQDSTIRQVHRSDHQERQKYETYRRV